MQAPLLSPLRTSRYRRDSDDVRSNLLIRSSDALACVWNCSRHDSSERIARDYLNLL